ncbi:YrrS family protein [Gottfriedia luciferensis]|uniref:YrrS family protein n=1 Tax=Gottfriedia luciferensis TaxID=178774 RepID=UPI00130268B6|nr:YrrS family protein [Gottfriedia luciferensis]
MKNFQSNSRTKSRSKRKKGKFILFGSIAIVLIVIIFVMRSIFSPADDKKAASLDSLYASAKNQTDYNKKKDKPDTTDNSTNNQVSEDSTSQDQTQNDETTSDTASADDSSSSSSSESSPAPETPEQTGSQHTTNYDSSSQDWQQMLQTISTATGIDQSNMTVWFLGSDKSTPGGSVGTVSAKTKGSQKFRVNLQWNGSGYTATKVEPVS